VNLWNNENTSLKISQFYIQRFMCGNTYVKDLILMQEFKVMYVETNMIFHNYLCLFRKRFMCVSLVS
jgi:hypothetical protein